MRTTRSKDGTILAYDVTGSGPALIYITGASCFRNFFPIREDVKSFSTRFTVYNYDRRGRGDSGNTLPYSVEREVEDIEAMIDAAGGKAFLYGHSSGAVLALEAALRLKHKVAKVVIYDASYVHNEEEKREYEKLRQTVESLLEVKNDSSAMKTFLKGIGMPKFFVFLLPLFPGWKTMKALAPTLSYDISLTKDLPPLERVAHISLPIHIIVGEKSPLGIRDVGCKLAAAIPNAKFTELAGEDHMVSSKTLLPLFSDFF
ncbi:alpha/beta fold hydrolase [Leptospira idonii]|uniref:Alpha/beta hydrolase n=1 Tax=Leptospira idonii TaxID=1193500 RepID=A0A4R9M1Q8_9LEPT|nr:alpha/beta hydrolase [Leptospira idonii]TGN20660.1 alpha/beta hydrolase [Leptospira idonii]